jgi:type IV pilus assembly protein PilC
MTFEYKALSKDGAVTNGKIEASSRGEAMSKLKADGFTLLDLVAASQEAGAKPSGSLMPAVEWSRIRPQQLAFLFRQLGELIDSGLPIVTAVGSLQRFCGHEKTKKLLIDVGNRVRSGQGFAEALAAQGNVFSRVHLALITVGERTGTLDDVLRRIAELMEAQLELRGKIRSALMYPFFILGFSSLLCWALVAFLLPTFEPIWKGANVDLSQYPVTTFLLDVSHLMRSPADEFLLLLFLGCLVAVFFRMTATPEGQHAWSTFVLKLPLLGGYLQISQTAEASSTMARLLECGIPAPEALELTAETASNPVIANALKTAALDLRQGNDLSAAFERMEVFPDLFVQMVSVGETTGNLPGMLHRVADYYRRQLDDSLKSLTSLLEPLMMVVIGGVVFVFVLGVFLPIMGIVSALSSGSH